MAAAIDGVFQHAFVPHIKPRKVDPKQTQNIFVMMAAHHQSPMLNRDLAAQWASRNLPVKAVDLWFAATGLERRKDLFTALQLSSSTLSRAKPDTTLDAAVTERMLRQSDLFVRAAEVFGEEGTAWMTKPHDLLGGKAPVEYAANEFGGAKVRAILNAIEYGGVV